MNDNLLLPHRCFDNSIEAQEHQGVARSIDPEEDMSK